MNATAILLRRQQVAFDDPIRNSDEHWSVSSEKQTLIGTLINNFVYYGYMPAKVILQNLDRLSVDALKAWWVDLEPALKAIKGDDKNIGDTIVYQNFPKEVLAMSDAGYWIRQFFIYWGVDPAELQAEKESRPQMLEELDLKVLQLAHPDALQQAFESLLGRPATWTENDKKEIEWFILEDYPIEVEIPFKENLVFVAIRCLWINKSIPMSTVTDVLRLAAGLSEGDIALVEPTKFRLRRAERRYLLDLLENTNDLEEGVMRHYEEWKRLFHQLHVGEYRDRYPKAFRVADAIRRGEKFLTFNSQVEALLEKNDPKVLALLASRPGEFARRVVSLFEKFGGEVLEHFLPVLSGLETLKLLKLKRFLLTLNNRRYRIFTPGGSWSKARYVENDKRIKSDYRNRIVFAIDEIVYARISKKFGEQFRYDPRIERIKLPTNDASAVTPFHKGTRLPIPGNIRFIRSATYWQIKGKTAWMDNGWNFFDANWQEKETVCWDHPNAMKPAAVFSGDPVNSYNPQGTAGQLIDLYPEEFAKRKSKRKVRYAVWNILSYSNIKFDAAEEVMGLLMLGEEADSGKLIEPSRVNFAIPVTGSGLAKYICYIDFVDREIVICDAGLRARVSSAADNSSLLETTMPAFQEYLGSLPSLMDVMEVFPNSEEPDAIPVLYSDEDVRLEGEKAYVFTNKNEDNSFVPITLEDFLTA